jgi:hypothetical protein
VNKPLSDPAPRPVETVSIDAGWSQWIAENRLRQLAVFHATSPARCGWLYFWLWQAM